MWKQISTQHVSPLDSSTRGSRTELSPVKCFQGFTYLTRIIFHNLASGTRLHTKEWSWTDGWMRVKLAQSKAMTHGRGMFGCSGIGLKTRRYNAVKTADHLAERQVGEHTGRSVFVVVVEKLLLTLGCGSKQDIEDVLTANCCCHVAGWARLRFSGVIPRMSAVKMELCTIRLTVMERSL